MGLNTKAIADVYCEDGPGTPQSALICPDCLLGVVPKQHSKQYSYFHDISIMLDVLSNSEII